MHSHAAGRPVGGHLAGADQPFPLRMGEGRPNSAELPNQALDQAVRRVLNQVEPHLAARRL
ncbi:MAG: hypothetical protein ACI835_000761 [Planctomycetota bacterium]|jgi:hypothetical protein